MYGFGNGLYGYAGLYGAGLGGQCPASVVSPQIQECGTNTSDPNYLGCMTLNAALVQMWLNQASAAGCLPVAAPGQPAADANTVAQTIQALGVLDFATIYQALPEASPDLIVQVLQNFHFGQTYVPNNTSGPSLEQVQAAYATTFPTATPAQLALVGNPTSGPQPVLQLPPAGPTDVSGVPVVVSTSGAVLPAGSNPNAGPVTVSTLTPQAIGTLQGAQQTSPGLLVSSLPTGSAQTLPTAAQLAAAQAAATGQPVPAAALDTSSLLPSSFFTDQSIIGGVANWTVLLGGLVALMLVMK